MMRRCLFILHILYFTPFAGHAQRADSLLKRLNQVKSDSAKVMLMGDLSLELRSSSADSAMRMADRAIALARKINFPKGLALSLRNKGIIYDDQGHFQEALRCYFESLKISAEKNDEKAMAATAGNIAIVYDEQADYPHALDYYFKATKLAMKLGDKDREAIQLGNIGNIYNELGDYDKALDFTLKAVKLDEEIGRKDLVTIWTGNLGNIYKSRHEYGRALEYYYKALQLDEADKNETAESVNLCNIGEVYVEQAKAISLKNKAEGTKLFDMALENFNRSLVLAEKLDYQELKGVVWGDLGNYYMEKKNYALAEKYFTLSLDLYNSMGSMDGIKDVELLFSSLDSAKGDMKNSYIHYRRYIAARDSIKNDDNVKKQTQSEMQFDFDKKEAADSVKVAEGKKIAAAELKNEQNKRYSLYGGLAIVFVFSGFIFNRFLVTRKQKMIIEEQKHIVEEQKQIVEEKNRDILDSIHYARRIQRALLPTEKYIDRNFKRLRKI